MSFDRIGEIAKDGPYTVTSCSVLENKMSESLNRGWAQGWKLVTVLTRGEFAEVALLVWDKRGPK